MPPGTVVDESTVRLARLDAAARRNSVGAFDGPFGNPLQQEKTLTKARTKPRKPPRRKR